MAESYRTIAGVAVGEIEVERSRFRCVLERVEDEQSARSVLEQVRREHGSARHHCTAMVIGEERSIERAGDDGEPPGTAGRPMLDVLRGSGLTDVVAVTSRWFGGVLLGTGGLSRAYADSVRTALLEVTPVERVLQELCEVVVDLAAVGQLEHELRSRGTTVLGIEYTDVAIVSLAVPARAVAIAGEIVEELTEGGARLHRVGQRWVDTPVS